ncbi:MAG: phosphoribosyl-AMP cyclohydrolase [Roseibacillus sp.]
MSDQESISFASREEQSSIDETGAFCPKFDSNGLIPALALDSTTKEPLMLAWMNEESLKQTLRIGEAVYYSRSRQEIWHKGATSGHTQLVKEIRTDCDQDVLLVYVVQQGAGACHTGRRSCFYRKIVPGDPSALDFVDDQRTFDPQAVYGDK